MNSNVFKYLKDNGYTVQSDYYNHIEMWEKWWRNYVEKFHTYYDQYGEKREIYKLGMGKKVCEDWASILFTERDEVVCGDKKNQDYIDTQLTKLKFDDIVPENIEAAFWSGTEATILRVFNAKVVNKKIVKGKDTYTQLINVDAEHIIPLRIDNGEIVDVAFVSDEIVNNKEALYLEIHELKDDGYKIRNIYIDKDGNEIVNDKVIPEYETGSKTPLFSILSPRLVNNIKGNDGLGVSIFANAIDQLKACDTAYNNYVKDLELGGKKVFYNKSLVKYAIRKYTDENGQEKTEEIPIYPDDLTRQQFQLVGDETGNPNEATLIQEHNPDLRIDDNEKAINLALNTLAFKTGLGKYYRFENGTVITATQYIGENKDLVSNAKKHRNALNEYTVGVARAILLVGRLIFGESVKEDDEELALTDKDGFLVSDEEIQDKYRQDYSAGLLSKKSYLMKARGMSEQEADEELARIKEDNNIIPDIIE